MKDKTKYQTSSTPFLLPWIEKGDIWFWVMTGSICKWCKLQVSSFPWSPCSGGSLVFLTWNQVDLTKYLKTAPQDPSSLNRHWVQCVMTWFLQLVLWKTCFYLQNECRARSSSFEILAFLMYHPGIFLSWLDRNLLSLEAKSDISIQCNKNIFWYLKFMDHPWLTRGTMDKTSPKSSFSVKQCQPLAARPFWDQLDGVHERL